MSMVTKILLIRTKSAMSNPPTPKISFSLDFCHLTYLEDANILYVSRKKIGTEISSFLGVVPHGFKVCVGGGGV